MEENFLTQLVREFIRANTPLDLLSTNRKGTVGDVMVRSCHGRSDRKRTEFSTFGESGEFRKTAALILGRAD